MERSIRKRDGALDDGASPGTITALVTPPAASAEVPTERRVRDTSTRPRRDVYAELLVTVGLFAIPATLNAVYAYVASELHFGTAGIGWLFASRAAQELLLIGLFFYVLRANGEQAGGRSLGLHASRPAAGGARARARAPTRFGVRRRFAYDEGRHPPAPVLPLHVGSPESDEDVLVASLVDSGADCTLVPAEMVRRLALPFVGRLLLVGIGGQTRPAPVHAARVRLAGLSCLARVIAFDGEAIIGRDLLNRVTVLLDGPRFALSVR